MGTKKWSRLLLPEWMSNDLYRAGRCVEKGSHTDRTKQQEIEIRVMHSYIKYKRINSLNEAIERSKEEQERLMKKYLKES